MRIFDQHGWIDCYACEKALCGDLADGLDYKNYGICHLVVLASTRALSSTGLRLAIGFIIIQVKQSVVCVFK